jgi:rubrerythrin
MAIQVILEQRQINLPVFREILQKRDLDWNTHSQEVLLPSKVVRFTRVDKEVSYQGFRPDVVGFNSNGEELLIEIYVTHAVDDEKKEKVCDYGGRMIEIDLSFLDEEQVSDPDRFSDAVLNDISNRKWIHCPEAEVLLEKARKNLEAKIKSENQKIADSREREEASRKSYEENRARHRAPYETDLNELFQLLEPEKLEALQHDQWKRAENVLASMREKMGWASDDWPPILNMGVPNDWVFGVHRSVWQGYIYQKFIHQKPVGHQLDPSVIKTQIVKEFGVNPLVKRLNTVKQKVKSEGKRKGKNYGNYGAWFFSAEENKAIPSPFHPVIKYLEMLVWSRVLENPEKTDFRVKENDLVRLDDRIQRALKVEKEIIARQELREKAQGMDTYKAAIKSAMTSRIVELSAEIRRLAGDGVKVVYACQSCRYPAVRFDSRCVSCGGLHADEISLSDEYLSTYANRLRFDPAIRISLMNPPLCSEWEDEFFRKAGIKE